MIVVVVGLGFVGLTLAVVLADKGLKVYGVEKNPQSYKKISKGISTFNEKGIEHYLKRNLGKNFFVYNKIEEIPNSADVFIICVATPIEDGSPNMKFIKSATEEVSRIITGDELLVIRSTIPVGTTRNLVLPLLESKLKERGIVKELALVYAPERTAEGIALHELTTLPQIIGGRNEKSLSRAVDVFRKLTSTVIQVSSIETAEMIKLIDNSYRDVRFAYANEITLICEKLGIDSFECITNANIHYARNNIPLPSPGVGGPCLTKDSYLLANDKDILEFLPNHQSLVLTGRKVNESIPYVLANKIKKIMLNVNSNNPKIFVIGFAFKGEPETSDIRESSTVTLVNQLKNEFKIYGYDPTVPKEIIQSLGVVHVEINEGFKNADCVVIMTNHKSFKNFDITTLLKESSKPCLFIDCWHLFDKKIFEKNKNIIYSGVGFA